MRALKARLRLHMVKNFNIKKLRKSFKNVSLKINNSQFKREGHSDHLKNSLYRNFRLKIKIHEKRHTK